MNDTFLSERERFILRKAFVESAYPMDVPTVGAWLKYITGCTAEESCALLAKLGFDPEDM